MQDLKTATEGVGATNNTHQTHVFVWMGGVGTERWYFSQKLTVGGPRPGPVHLGVGPYQSTWESRGSGHWTALGPRRWGWGGSVSSPGSRSRRSWWWCLPSGDIWGSAPRLDWGSRLLGGFQGYTHLQNRGWYWWNTQREAKAHILLHIKL